MKDKTLKILLSIIAINLTVQTVRDVGLFSTSYAQSDVQRVTICNELGDTCAGVTVNPQYDSNGSILGSTRALRVSEDSSDGISF
tara:strand:+ start:219 stop:473 length:255 start_codon:yes stop_codon:yes gene_type:complete